MTQCYKPEFVIIVGAEDYYSDEDGHNKHIFMMSAIRYVRIFASSFEKTKVFYFKGKSSIPVEGDEGGTYFADGYTDTQCNRFEQRIQAYGGEVTKVSTWSEICTYLNETRLTEEGCELKISSFIFFCHGSVGAIWLEHKNKKYLTNSEIGQLNSSSFIDDRYRARWPYPVHTTSWACQTANSSVTDSTEERVKGSLAYKMSEAWGVEVYAACRQTVYTGAFNGLEDKFYEHIIGYDTPNRYMLDGCVWEDDGADNAVIVSSSRNSGDYRPVPRGMFSSDAENDRVFRKNNLT